MCRPLLHLMSPKHFRTQTHFTNSDKSKGRVSVIRPRPFFRSHCSARETFRDFVARSCRMLPEMTNIVVVAGALAGVSAIKTPTPDEHIWNVEAHEVKWHLSLLPHRFVEHYAGHHLCRTLKFHQADQIFQSPTTVTDIVHQDHGVTGNIPQSRILERDPTAAFVASISAGMQETVTVLLRFQVALEVHQKVDSTGQNPCQHDRVFFRPHDVVKEDAQFGNPLLNHLPRNQKIPIGNIQPWPERHLASSLQHTIVHQIPLSAAH